MGVNGHWYVEIRKQAYWRGAQHTWVNRYVMSGSQPSAADAVTVINAIKGIEDSIFPSVSGGAGVGFVDGKAYPSGSGSYFAIASYNETEGVGTATGFSGSAYTTPAPAFSPALEVCFLLETPLNGLSSTGKPVSLRKYYRGMSSGDDTEEGGGINGAIITAMEAATLPFQTGMAANNWVVIGNKGEQASGPPVVRPHLYNRQVPKGRKRSTASLSLTAHLLKIVGENPEITAAAALAEL